VSDEVLDDSSLLKHDPQTVGNILPSVEPEITYDSDLDSGSTENYYEDEFSRWTSSQ
jgi:hypothetical protein